MPKNTNKKLTIELTPEQHKALLEECAIYRIQPEEFVRSQTLQGFAVFEEQPDLICLLLQELHNETIDGVHPSWESHLRYLAGDEEEAENLTDRATKKTTQTQRS